MLLCVALAVAWSACHAGGDGQDARERLLFSAPHSVTVAQLTQIVGKVKGDRDGNTAKEIEHLQLTERLSTPKLASLSSALPGGKSKVVLMAIGDASVFLEPPKSEIPNRAKPDIAEQRQIMSRVVDYLKRIIPKLPNFYAKRFTTSFEEIRFPKDKTGTHDAAGLHRTGEFRATVYYRAGKEIVRAEGAEEHGLTTRGTFGPILSTVIVDAAHSSLKWGHWEEGPSGPMAVFQIQVPQAESHYEASFWGAMPGGGDVGAMAPTAYHAEIGIDPTSGRILRLMLEADPELGSPIQSAEIMVEYGPVVIGGKVYTCPVRSVSMSTGLAAMREVTRLDDVVFSDYHVFRSEMRIVP